MSLLSLGITALTWALFALFLEPVYLTRKRGELQAIADAIGPLPDSLDGLYGKLAGLERSTAVHITVVGADGRVRYDSNAPFSSAAPFRDEFTPPGPRAEGPARPPPVVPSRVRPGPRGGRGVPRCFRLRAGDRAHRSSRPSTPGFR
jgi:hypothetical protein